MGPGQVPDLEGRTRNYDFFQGAQLHLQKSLTGVVYRNQYIFGLPAEI